MVRRVLRGAARFPRPHEVRLRVPAGVREGATVPLQRRAAGGPADLRRSPDYNPLTRAISVLTGAAVPIRCNPEPTSMRPHLHLLGILQLVWGAIGLLLGVSMLLLAIGAVAIGVDLGGRPDGRRRHRRRLRRVRGRAARRRRGQRLGRRALRRNRPRGRLAVLWLGALNLFVLPFGTALGIYAFWVLLHNETRAAFVARSARLSAVAYKMDSQKDRQRLRRERRRRRSATVWLGHRAPVFRDRAAEQLRALPRDAVDARVRRGLPGACCVCLSIPFLGWILSIFVFYGSAALWLLLMFKAYQGERFKLPVAGDIAEQRRHSEIG